MFTALLLLSSFSLSCGSESPPDSVDVEPPDESEDVEDLEASRDACVALQSGSPLEAWEHFTTKVVPLVKSGDDAEALKQLDCLSWQLKGLVRVRYLRGRLLEKLDRFRDAADALDLDERLLPESVAYELRVRRGALLARTGRCAQARKSLKKLGRRKGIGQNR